MRRNYVTKRGMKIDKNGRAYIGRVRMELSCSEVTKFIEMAEKQGYSTECIEEGVLGHGKVILWAPAKDWQNFIIRETYKNEWSSVHEIEWFWDVYPELQEEIDNSIDRMNGEVTA